MATTRLGGARIDLTGQSASLEKAMARASKAFDKQERDLKRLRKQAQRANKAHAALNKTVGALAGVVGVGAIAAGLKAAVQDATAFSTKLVEGARNTGLLETRLEAIAHVFAQDGIGFQATTTALATFQKRISEVGDGLATYTRSFDKLGLSYERLRKLTPEEQFYTLVEAIAAVEDQTIRQQAAQDLLGRAGKQLVGTIVQLRGGWRGAVDDADALTKATAEMHRTNKGLTGELERLEQKQRDLAVQFSAENAKGILFWASAWTDLKIAALGAAGAVGDFLAFVTGFGSADGAKSIGEIDAEIRKLTASIQKAQAAGVHLLPSTAGRAHPIVVQYARDNARLEVLKKRRNELLLSAPDMGHVDREPIGTAVTGGEHYTDPYGPLGLEKHYESVNAATRRGRDLLAELTEQRKRDAEAARIQAQAVEAAAEALREERAEIERRARAADAAYATEGSDSILQAIAEQDERLAQAHAETIAARMEAERQYAQWLEETEQRSFAAAMAARQAWTSAAEGMADAFAQAFSSFLAGTASAEDAFRSFAQGVIQELIRIQQAAIAAEIFGFLSGLFIPGGANRWGGGGRVPGPHRGAQGGLFPAGRARIVGETGPELEFPAYQTRVIPWQQLAGGGGGGTVNNIKVYGDQNKLQVMGWVREALAEADVMTRGGFIADQRYPTDVRGAIGRGARRG